MSILKKLFGKSTPRLREPISDKDVKNAQKVSQQFFDRIKNDIMTKHFEQDMTWSCGEGYSLLVMGDVVLLMGCGEDLFSDYQNRELKRIWDQYMGDYLSKKNYIESAKEVKKKFHL